MRFFSSRYNHLIMNELINFLDELVDFNQKITTILIK